MAEPRESLRLRVYDILERSRRHDSPSVFFDIFMVVLIVANVSAAVIETVPEIDAVWGRHLFAFEVGCVAIFAVEYILRLWAAPEHPMYRGMNNIEIRLRHARTPLLILDLVAILPIFL
jgi:voltage-gated potassium channel